MNLTEEGLVSTYGIYVNGMNTSIESAQQICKQLAANKKMRFELTYNDATTPEACRKIAVRSLPDITSGHPLLVAARYMTEQQEISPKIRKVADRVVQSAKRILSRSPKARVVLVGHSQGADVLDLALNSLARFKDRIDVETYGGITYIEESKARSVVNYVGEDDILSRLAHAVNYGFRGQGGNKSSSYKGKDCSGHSAKCYVPNGSS